MKIQKRRRRENKTDYLKRIKLLKSDKPRIVFRKTNRYILSQYVTSHEAQDRVVFSVNSKDLIKYGWPKDKEGSLKSLTASYMTGYLTGKEIHKRKAETPIIDFGMIKVMHKTKTFAFIKGLIDAGVKINCDKKDFPNEDRIKGEHLNAKISFNEIKSKIDKL